MNLRKISLVNILFCMGALMQGNLVMAQQLCNDEAIMNTKGHWAKRNDANPFPDSSFPKSQFVQANNRMDKMQKLLQAAYPDPKGIEAGWYRSISGNALVKGGPAPYKLSALFLTYYCNNYEKKIELGDETGTWFYVWANQFNWFAEYIKEFSVKKQAVYLLTRKNEEIDGYPVYEGIHNGTSNTGTTYSRAIIITRQGQSPYVPVTQKQYLKAFLLYNEKKLPESLAGIEKGFVVKTDAEEKEAKQKALAGIEKNNRADAVERRKAEYLKNYKTDRQRKDENIQHTTNYFDGLIKPVDDVWKSLGENELKEPAIVDAVNSAFSFKGFTTEEKGGRMIVFVNSNYFNTKLPGYVPQLVVLYWQWDKNTPAQNFKKQIEENFPISKLKAMIDK